jgi:hypothetical protein
MTRPKFKAGDVVVKRGRPSNWDTIVEHVGGQAWLALKHFGVVKNRPNDPNRGALRDLGAAVMRASADALGEPEKEFRPRKSKKGR